VRRCGAANLPVLWLDSDDLRRILTPDPTYSDNERDFFYGALGELAILGSRGGVFVVISATASKKAYRDNVRRQVHRFAEIWLQCDAAKVRQRDPKGLYAQAKQGVIANMPGHDSTFEAPVDAERILDSTDTPLEKLLVETLMTIKQHLEYTL
ncbi:MAG: adenylyl-sulfate kinase, partial [Myxococcota bacterium]